MQDDKLFEAIQKAVLKFISVRKDLPIIYKGTKGGSILKSIYFLDTKLDD